MFTKTQELYDAIYSWKDYSGEARPCANGRQPLIDIVRIHPSPDRFAITLSPLAGGGSG